MMDWFGELPERWEQRYLSQMCKEKCVKNIGNQEANVLSLSYGQIIRKRNIYSGLSPKDYATYQIVDPGNIILRLTDLQNDHVSLRTGLVRERGIITSAYVCLQTNENYSYLQYLLHSYDTQKYLYGLGGGVRQSIGYKDIRYINLPLPPREEQDQIVHYLDWKVSQINKLINAKKKQIALLHEQKQAVINQAVTCGGQGWKEHKLAKIATITLSGLDKKSYDGQTPVLLCNYVDVYKNDYITSELDFMKATASEPEKASLKLQFDDIIITKDSESWDDIGVPAYVAEEIDDLYCGYHLAIIRSNKEILNGEYLFFAFQSQNIQIQHKIKARGVTRFSLGYQPIHDTNVLVPPLEYQLEIVQDIKKKCELQKMYIASVNQQITLLHEYRTRLISDVVTGKLDVRGVEIPNYEMVEKVVDVADVETEETEGEDDAY